MHGPQELLGIQIETLFRLDAQGRIATSNALPVPRVYLGRTLEGQRLLLRDDLPDARVAELEAIAAREPRIEKLWEPPPPSREFHSALGSVEREYRGPAFWLPESCDDARAAELVTPENVERLAGPFGWLGPELADVSPAIVSLQDGVAVSVCHCARQGPSATEAETVEAARGRGHARRCVAAWAAHVRAAGRLPLYSTWWQNAASLALAASLGAVPYAEDFHLT